MRYNRSVDIFEEDNGTYTVAITFTNDEGFTWHIELNGYASEEEAYAEGYDFIP